MTARRIIRVLATLVVLRLTCWTVIRETLHEQRIHLPLHPEADAGISRGDHSPPRSEPARSEGRLFESHLGDVVSGGGKARGRGGRAVARILGTRWADRGRWCGRRGVPEFAPGESRGGDG